MLKHSNSAEQWLDVVDQYKDVGMNHINASAAASAAGHILSQRQNDPETDQAVYNELLQLLQTNRLNMNARGISIGLWSLAKAHENRRIQHDSMFGQIFYDYCEDALQLQDEFGSQALAGVIWAMAKVNVQLPQIFSGLIKRAVSSVSELQSQEIAIITWAMGAQRYSNLEHIEQFVALSKQHFTEFSTQNISNVIWALSKLRYRDDDLLSLVEHSLHMSRNEFTFQQLSNTLLAFATLNYDLRQQTIEKIFGRFLYFIKSQRHFSLQEPCNMLYALGIIKGPIQQAQVIVDSLALDDEAKMSKLLPSQLRQMYRTWMQYRAMGCELTLPSTLISICKKDWLSYVDKRCQQKNSQFAEDVFVSVQKHFPEAVRIRTDKNGLLEVRNSIERIGGKKVTIRVLEPNMVIVNQPQIMLGNVKAYNELLEYSGWHIILVSKEIWQKNGEENLILQLKQFFGE
eukprot:TRINITY_DN3864_c0_g1_i2.p1 TRINITY_DN3864_c0_g1~~TRINITY_DN3864_c0_g1_i2.p1  ORF type:complete len:494 (-),score=55.74 TRINITY_DN3864_c0_g1_i2:202-1575(-)